jgi:hypothetical protein
MFTEGIFSKRNKDDVNLEQGRELLGYSDEYVRVLRPHLRELQLSTSPDLSSIVEALNTTESTSASHIESKSKISNLEDRFNKTLGEYARTSDQINELLLRRHHKGLDSYNGMIVTTDGDQSFVYVNDYGFTHKYPRESPKAEPLLDQSCEKLKRAKIKQSTLNKLQKGRAMSPGEPCGIAGKNVQRGDSDEHAWISIDGLKHVYPTHVWQKKNESCRVPAIKLSDAAYDAIPSGSAMTTSAECEQGGGVSPALWDQLYKLNGELAHLTQLLTKEVDNLATTDMKLTQKLEEQKMQLAEHTSSLVSDRKKIENNFQTAIGANQDARLKMQSDWVHYIVWVILAVTVVSIVIHAASMNAPGRAAQIVVLIAALIAVYSVASWIDRHYL